MPDSERSPAAAPGGPPRRTCRTCSIESATWSPRCPACGVSYDGPRVPARVRLAGALVAAAALGGAIAYAAPRIEASRDAEAARSARAAAAREAAERARVARDQEPVRGLLLSARDDPALAGPRRIARRQAMVTAFEAAVKEDADRRFRAGTSDGPVTGAICRPLLHTHGGRRDDLDLGRRVGRFECLATTLDVRAHGRRVGMVGQPYVGSIDFRSATYVLCKYHPPPGEGGVMLAQVPLHPSCFGAADRSELASLGIRENPRD